MNYELDPKSVSPERVEKILAELNAFCKERSATLPSHAAAKFYEISVQKTINNLSKLYQEGEAKCCPDYRITHGFPKVTFIFYSDYDSSADLDTSGYVNISTSNIANDIQHDCSCYLLAQLETIYQKVAIEHQHNLQIYTDYDQNIDKFMEQTHTINQLGGNIVPNRPYITLDLPDPSTIGVNTFTKVPCNKLSLLKLKTYLQHLSHTHGAVFSIIFQHPTNQSQLPPIFPHQTTSPKSVIFPLILKPFIRGAFSLAI